jgi:hypothetical protein
MELDKFCQLFGYRRPSFGCVNGVLVDVRQQTLAKVGQLRAFCGPHKGVEAVKYLAIRRGPYGTDFDHLHLRWADRAIIGRRQLKVQHQDRGEHQQSPKAGQSIDAAEKASTR